MSLVALSGNQQFVVEFGQPRASFLDVMLDIPQNRGFSRILFPGFWENRETSYRPGRKLIIYQQFLYSN
jgi:hypothetical protein